MKTRERLIVSFSLLFLNFFIVLYKINNNHSFTTFFFSYNIKRFNRFSFFFIIIIIKKFAGVLFQLSLFILFNKTAMLT
jgi:hypothetical protein